MMLLILLTASACDKEKKITVTLTVPDTSWNISINEVYKVDSELWVISRVFHKPGMMGAQVISTISDSVTIKASNLPVKNIIIGKTWGWENDEPYAFIRDLKEIEKELESGKLVYKEDI
jgi:hypothetical protein